MGYRSGYIGQNRDAVGVDQYNPVILTLVSVFCAYHCKNPNFMYRFNITKNAVALALICISFGGGQLLSQTTVTEGDTTAEIETADRFVRIVLNDGGVRLGQMLSEDADVIRLQTKNLGELNIPKYLVSQMMDLTDSEYDRLSTSRAGRTGRINPQSSRYFFAPSGIQLKQGEG